MAQGIDVRAGVPAHDDDVRGCRDAIRPDDVTVPARSSAGSLPPPGSGSVVGWGLAITAAALALDMPSEYAALLFVGYGSISFNAVVKSALQLSAHLPCGAG